MLTIAKSQFQVSESEKALQWGHEEKIGVAIFSHTQEMINCFPRLPAISPGNQTELKKIERFTRSDSRIDLT